MSNLSDIGFPVKSDQDVNQVLMDVMTQLEQIPCQRGFYYRFEDKSGAEIYLQANTGQDLIGFNPAFGGKSRRKAGLAVGIERDTSELDGAFYAWANPSSEEDADDKGEYPFVFDVPDFRLYENIELPQTVEVQITAFASNDFRLFETEKDYMDSQQGGAKSEAKSFAASKDFDPKETESEDAVSPPQAHGVFTGEIREFESRINNFTKESFYWFLVETLGGEIDVVVDPKLVSNEPRVGGIVSGSFWLSGKILS